MCIIIWKPAGIKLLPDTISTSFTNNPDGAGFTYIENETLHTRRGFLTMESFREAYTPHETKAALLHFRIRTHGDYSEENCHPFEVTPNMVFAHNGTIHTMPVDKIKSDTAQFNELVVKNMVRVYGKRLFFDPLFIPILESYVGWSRIVFLTNKGEVSIISEKDGKWVDKCWFSNNSWQERVHQPYVFPEGIYDTNGNNWPHNAGKHDWKKWNKHGKVISLPSPSGNRTSSLTTEDDWPKSETFPLPTIVDNPLPPQHRPLQNGDYLRLNQAMLGCEKGWLGKAMGFYEDGSVEIYFPIHRQLKRISILYLDRVTPNVIANTRRDH